VESDQFYKARVGVRTLGDVVVNKMKPKEAFVNRAGEEVEEFVNDTIKGRKRKAQVMKRPRHKRRKVTKENF
jgi:hypothetical protein